MRCSLFSDARSGGRKTRKGTDVSNAMTMLVGAYVLPAALTTYVWWQWYLQAAPQPRLARAGRPQR